MGMAVFYLIFLDNFTRISYFSLYSIIFGLGVQCVVMFSTFIFENMVDSLKPLLLTCALHSEAIHFHITFTFTHFTFTFTSPSLHLQNACFDLTSTSLVYVAFSLLLILSSFTSHTFLTPSLLYIARFLHSFASQNSFTSDTQ